MSFESDYSEYNVRLCNRMLRRWGRARCRAMGMPTDPENAPGEFGRWLSAARDRAAAIPTRDGAGCWCGPFRPVSTPIFADSSPSC